MGICVAVSVAALDALSVGVRLAIEGGGVQDKEMCEILTHLDITPGKPAHPAAIEAVREWAELEEQEEIAEALMQDAKDSILNVVNDTCGKDKGPSEDELDEGFESPEEVSLMAPPPYSEISSLFGQLEQYAESCGISEAGCYLRRAKMSFLAAHASRPARQTDIRAMFSKT